MTIIFHPSVKTERSRQQNILCCEETEGKHVLLECQNFYKQQHKLGGIIAIGQKKKSSAFCPDFLHVQKLTVDHTNLELKTVNRFSQLRRRKAPLGPCLGLVKIDS